MNNITLKWIIGVLITVIVLGATYYVVDLNQKAMSGSENEKTTASYGH